MSIKMKGRLVSDGHAWRNSPQKEKEDTTDRITSAFLLLLTKAFGSSAIASSLNSQLSPSPRHLANSLPRPTMAPPSHSSNIAGLNRVHPVQPPSTLTASEDLLTAPSFPGLAAQLDLWSSVNFAFDEPLPRGLKDRKSKTVDEEGHDSGKD